MAKLKSIRYRATRDFVVDMIKHPKPLLGHIEYTLAEYRMIKSVFIEQEYRWLAEQLKLGTTVLDLGAYMGETAIYFAQFREVKKVIAYEAAPIPFSITLKNISLNKLEKKITAKNIAILEKEGRIKVDEHKIDTSGDSYTITKSQGNIKAITLNKAVKGLINVAIKCDIEGGEENLFDNADMSQVYAIELEYHSFGIYKKLYRVLTNKGFKVGIASRKNQLLYAKKRVKSIRATKPK